MAKYNESELKFPEFNSAGQKICRLCGNLMVELGSKKGIRCGVPGNRWNPEKKCWSKCNYAVFSSSPFANRQTTSRPDCFPEIRTPTDEQKEIRRFLASNPRARGNCRCLIVDAGPGTGKSTTMAWSAEAIYQRIQDLVSYWIVAFNVNARISLEEKLPQLWSNIATINSFGGRLQNYKATQYNQKKLFTIFSDMVNHIEYEDRPKMGSMASVIERMRDLCLFSKNESDTAFWKNAVALVAMRFPQIAKKLQKESFAKVVDEYLSSVATRAHSINNVIDINEQYSRPVTEAIRKTGWKPSDDMVSRNYKWNEADIASFANLVRAVSLEIPQQTGIIVDEAQDLSLVQIALFLGATWRNGEITFVGDDELVIDNVLIKAGQGIFGWRGAFPGSLSLIERTWNCLTGEKVTRLPLNVTHRCPPEVVDAVRPLDSKLQSTKPYGTGEALSVSQDTAWLRWIDAPEMLNGKPYKCLVISRTNAILKEWFIETIKARKQVCLRGGEGFSGQLEGIYYNIAGVRDKDTNQYPTRLNKAIENLKAWIAENTDPNAPAGEGENDIANFLIGIMEEVNNNPSILADAKLPTVGTVGNVRLFLQYFENRDASRVLSTVYRSKGDEAHLVIVCDTERFNQVWNGDESESRACRKVAATRAINSLLVIGNLAGVNTKGADDDGTKGIEEIMSSSPAPTTATTTEPKRRGRPKGSKNKPK